MTIASWGSGRQAGPLPPSSPTSAPSQRALRRRPSRERTCATSPPSRSRAGPRPASSGRVLGGASIRRAIRPAITTGRCRPRRRPRLPIRPCPGRGTR
jgi:hypothetical protein